MQVFAGCVYTLTIVRAVMTDRQFENHYHLVATVGPMSNLKVENIGAKIII